MANLLPKLVFEFSILHRGDVTYLQEGLTVDHFKRLLKDRPLCRRAFL